MRQSTKKAEQTTNKKSWMADKVEQWPIDKLIPYARNARKHSDEQIAQIAASIIEFGFTNPILAGGDGVIVAGHGRLAAAQKLGLEFVPVVVLDHLDANQRRALVIADNRIAENAEWDEDGNDCGHEGIEIVCMEIEQPEFFYNGRRAST